MQAIRTLLQEHARGALEDAGLAWGAAVSAYVDKIRESLRRGETPVLVELAHDLPESAFDRSRCLVVDHHGPLAGADRPTSLEQVFALLGLPGSAWTREHTLIAANDRGHIRAMLLLDPPATPEEIRAIRARDRRAQGIGEADETEARRAIAGRRVRGRLTVVETTARSSTAVADALEPVLGGPGYEALLVVMPETLAVFADGDTIRWLASRIPGSWFGGDLPDRGFWGAKPPPGPERDRLVAELGSRLDQGRGTRNEERETGSGE